MRVKKFKFLLLILFLLGGSRESLASGFWVPETGARATAFSACFTARADDVSAIAHNPAGLTQLKGSNIQFDFGAIIGDFEYVHADSGATIQMEKEYGAYPNFAGFCSDLGFERWRFAIGAYLPFGEKLEYPFDGEQRRISRVSDLTTIYYSAVLAYEILPERLSFGAGVNLADSLYQVKKAVYRSDIGIEVDVDIDLEDVDYCFTFGSLYKPFSWLSLGFNYVSPITFHYKGDLKVDYKGTRLQTTPSNLRFPVPDIFRFGGLFRINRKLSVELDYNYVRWSRFDQLPMEIKGQDNVVFIKDWNDAHIFRTALEYLATDRVNLMFGMLYDRSVIPDERLELGTPDLDKIGLSTGLLYQLLKWKFSFSYLHIFSEEKDITDSLNEPNSNGKYRYGIDIVLMGIYYLF